MTGTPDSPDGLARAASDAVEAWARTAPPRPPGPYDDLAWLLDAGLEVRIAPHAAGVKLTILDGGEQVGEPVTLWPTVIVGAALAIARLFAEAVGRAPGGTASDADR